MAKSIFVLLLSSCFPGICAEALPESFESGIPAYVSASRAGAISVSHLHSKHGECSLRWDWQGGDTVRLAHGLGNIRRVGGYGGSYSKATFGVWLYNTRSDSGAIVFEFRKGDEVGGTFRFPLTFRAWQRAHLRYSWRPQFEGSIAPDTDSVLLRAPPRGAGTVFIDLLTYNGIMDYRQQHIPKAEGWTRPPRGTTGVPASADVTPRDLAGLQQVQARMHAEASGSGAVTAALVESLGAEVAKWRISHNPDGSIQGRPIVKDAAYYSELGLEDVDRASALCVLMKRLGTVHAHCTEPGLRRRLAGWYVDLSDHIADQGMRPGNGFSWGWYNGRDLATATFLMRDVLRDAGRLERDADYFDSNYGFSRIFDDATIHPNMDYFHNDMRNIIRGALMQPTDAERVRCLKAVSRRLTLDILHEGENGFHADGSAFHHGMHYFAYANYSTNTLCALLGYLGGTPFQVSTPALDQVKRVLLAMRFYCNWTDLPLPLCGRHPHSQGVSTAKFLWLAKAYANDEMLFDPTLAAAYLRFHPDRAAEEPFASAGIKPEPEPQGAMTMPRAGLLAIRQDRWLAVVKGYSRTVRFGEIYANNNRFGRYLSHGYLDILAGGNPVTRADSGCVPDGWDWNRLDGTTVIVLPQDKLRAVSRGTEHVSTDETYCGAATQGDHAAVFGLKLHGAKRHDASFRARKSVHWLGGAGALVCLGSAIECADAAHPVQTNLFQKALPTPKTVITLDDRPVKQVGEVEVVSPGSHWILDTQNTAFIIPAGQRLVVTRRRQVNRDQHDKKELEGDFACAWLDHGAAPTAGTYQYVAIPNATAAKAQAWNEKIGSADTAPYQVLRHDRIAHVVATGNADASVVTAAFFESGDSPETAAIPSLAVDSPCLVVVSTRGDKLTLSVTDPDLHLEKNSRSAPSNVSILIGGRWLPVGEGTGESYPIRIESGRTRVTVSCQDGLPTTVALQRSPAP